MDIQDRDSKYKLAFLSLCETLSHDGYMGAVLVTNEYGIPQEFRCTYPVRPTMVQKALYGSMLETYIGVQICGLPLLKSLKISPDLILVKQEFLLNLRKFLEYPTVCIYRAGEVIAINTPEDKNLSDSIYSILQDKSQSLIKERIESPSGRFQPIIMLSSPLFDGDSLKAREIIENASLYVDPLEPFERINKAIEIIAKQDKRFQ